MAMLTQSDNRWSPGQVPENDNQANHQTSSLPPLRALVVEDDFLVAMTIEHAIRAAGMEAIGIAPTKARALEMCRTLEPDFVTMDVNLRGDQVGVEIALEIAERFGLRSLFISAYTGDKVRAESARPANPFGWVDKPFTTQHLVSRLNEVAGKIRDHGG